MNLQSFQFKLIIPVLALSLFIISCESRSTPGQATTVNDDEVASKNKAVIQELVQALNDTNWVKISSLIHSDYQHYSISDSGYTAHPYSYFEQGFRAFKTAFPDWHLTVDQMVAEGEMVSSMVTGRGTHSAPLAGLPAKNNKVVVPLMIMSKFKDGKIIADWEMADTGMMMNQMK